jgi:hypothetical protein
MPPYYLDEIVITETIPRNAIISNLPILWQSTRHRASIAANPCSKMTLLILGMKKVLDAWNFVPNHPAFQQRTKITSVPPHYQLLIREWTK